MQSKKDALFKYCPDGKSKLHTAAADTNKETLQNILSVYEGSPCLHVTAECYKKQSLKCLVEKEMAKLVNKKDKFGKTPLHYAATATNAELLIKFGALLDVQDKVGNTPLHAALFDEKEGVVEVLLNRGARIDIVNDKWEMVFDLTFSSPELPVDPIKKHIIKIEIAKLAELKHVPWEMNLSDLEMNEFEDQCRKELEKIQGVKFNHVSLLDVLRKDTDPLFARCADLITLLESPSFKTDYPIYSGILDRKMKQAKIRLAILDKAAKKCVFNFPETSEKSGSVCLPLETKRKILILLGIEDLRNVILAVELIKY